MGHEYTVSFASVGWYEQNRDRLHSIVANWQSFVREPKPNEIWLKSSDSAWDFDIRVFFRATDIFLEVSAIATAAWHRDVRRFLAILAQETECELQDDDGVALEFGHAKARVEKTLSTYLGGRIENDEYPN